MDVWLPLLTAFVGFSLGLVATLIAETQKERWQLRREARQRKEARADVLAQRREDALLELQDHLPTMLHTQVTLGSLERQRTVLVKARQDASQIMAREDEVFRELMYANSRARMLIGRAGDPDLATAADAYLSSLGEFREAEIAWRVAVENDASTTEVLLQRAEAEKMAMATLEALQYFVSRKLFPPEEDPPA